MKTLFHHEQDGKHEMVIVPTGDVGDVSAGVKFHPLGVDIYSLDMELLRTEVAKTLAQVGESMGNTALMTSDQVQRAVFTSVARFIHRATTS